MIKLKARRTEKRERQTGKETNTETDYISGLLVPVFALGSEGGQPDIFHVSPFQTGPRGHRQLVLEETEAQRREGTWLTV